MDLGEGEKAGLSHIEPILQQIQHFIEMYFSPTEQHHLPHYFVLTDYAPEAYLPYFYNMVYTW